MNTHRNGRKRDARGIAIGVLSAVIVVSSIVLVVVNQQTVGWINLGLMLLGLIALIVMLALYNRRYR